MNKLILALALIPMMAMGEMKVATVDLMLLLRSHPLYEQNDKFLADKSKELQKKTDDIKAEGEKLQAEGEKLMEQCRNPMLSDKAKAELESKLQELRPRLMEIGQRYHSEMMRGNEDLQNDRVKLMKSTTEDLRAKLKAFAEKSGYDVILDTNVTAYAKDSLDVTDAFIVEMGWKKYEGK